jgi:hypothetical protein
MGVLHPAEPLGRLDLHGRRQRLGIVECRGLDVDDTGQHLGIAMEKAGAAIGAEAVHRRT